MPDRKPIWSPISPPAEETLRALLVELSCESPQSFAGLSGKEIKNLLRPLLRQRLGVPDCTCMVWRGLACAAYVNSPRGRSKCSTEAETRLETSAVPQ